MEFQALIKQRYSVRAYKPDDVPSNIIDKVLEAARLAPTAANRRHRDMRDYGRKLGSQGWKELC
jgi:nitroreductase